jgi:hypothetical protein
MSQDPDVLQIIATQFALHGRRAVVTGASSGLGKRFARVLDAAGARVALVARRQDLLEGLAEELTDPLVIVADLADPSAQAEVIETAYSGLGGIDVLVNNAGRAVPGPAVDGSDFRAVVELNLTAPFELCRHTARHSIDDGAALSIINIASILGLVGSRSLPQASYAASKAGLAHLTRQLAAEWARSNIRVNAIAPGWFPSELTRETMFDDPKGAKFVERNTPMGRGGSPHELDGPLLFLASDASSYVTGHVMVVDGGWTLV